MRYREFTIEDSFGGMLDNKVLKESFELIKRDCQPYLQQNKSPIFSTPLFRGMSDVKDIPLIKKQVRLDRRLPSDMPDRVQDVINDWMTKEFGEPFRNAIFVSGSENTALSYGQVYMVFPIGKFTFLHHNKFEDMYATYSHFTWQYDEKQVGDAAIAKFRQKYIEYIASADNGKWSQDNIEQAIKSGNEIMIRCREYYAVNYPAVRMLSANTKFETMAQVEKELLG